ncbi:hypothetical protein AVEN_11911-1 [Araneus ventricosus]|uniref:Uncharacterized protein n=1 Tax=Araneus ventricosus TaxID=182803 RepID=A0A4Y2ETD3_ARAVE|nr:hypothetical protein AVEN_11911-1 [Araneus ventricosus]
MDGATTGPKEFCRPLGKALKPSKLPVAPFSSISVENMPHNIDRMVLNNDQQYLYDICLPISRGECYSDLALRKPGPVVHSRWLKIAVVRTETNLSACEQKEKHQALLDLAKESINKAKDLHPTCENDSKNVSTNSSECGAKEKVSAYLEIAKNLIEGAKNNYST